MEFLSDVLGTVEHLSIHKFSLDFDWLANSPNLTSLDLTGLEAPEKNPDKHTLQI